MQFRSAARCQSGAVSCPLSGTSAGQSARFTGRRAIATTKDRTSRPGPSSYTTTEQCKRRRIDTVSLPVTKATVSTPDQQTETSAIGCKELFRLTVGEFSSHSLNREHSRLIVQNFRTRQTQIWQADQNGSFAHSFSFDSKINDEYAGQQDPDILFVSGLDLHEVTDLLHVYERTSSGKWVKTQALSVDDLADDPPPSRRSWFFYWDFPARLSYSNDSNSVVCLSAGVHGTILGRGADGLWTNRGRCGQYHHAGFSADNNHIALTYNDKLSLMSKGANGWWSETGCVKLGFGELQQAFSPDSRHFASWFERTGEDNENRFYADYGRCDFFLMLFSLDDQGRWTEKQRITKYLSKRRARYTLKAQFSPDGKHLAVCSGRDFDLWTLNKDNCWTPALEGIPYQQRHCIKRGNYSVINFTADSSSLMVVNDNSATVWALQDSGQWQNQHSFCYQSTVYPQISPDAKTIVCENESDERGFWQRQEDGQWTWQGIINGDMKQPRFNRDGSLLAFIDHDKQMLVLMAPGRNGDWKEKRCLQFKNRVRQFEFDPSGRSVQVTCKEGNNEVVSFWRLGVDGSATGS